MITNERRRQALVGDHVAFDRGAEIEEASSFAAFGGCFRSLSGGRGAFAPLLYDAFAVERLFYMACGSRTYVESDKLSLSTYVRRGMENKSLEIGWWLYAQDGSGPA